jgi:hypothetical protein
MRGMNLPPNERRAVPRHIRDGEHEGWHDAAEAASGRAPRRRFRLWIFLVAAAALIAGLWLRNS